MNKPSVKRLLILAALFTSLSSCDAQKDTAPVPIPEQKLPLPEFLGTYAIDEAKAIPLKGAPQWTAVDVTSAVEFVLYDQAAAQRTENAKLTPFLLDPAVSMFKKLEWDQEHVERIPGAPRGFQNYGGGSPIELLRKPIAGHADMMRLIPAAQPGPGFYTISLGTATFGVWVDRPKFDEQVTKTRADVERALADPLLSKREIAHTIVLDLQNLCHQISSIAYANKLPDGSTVPMVLLTSKFSGSAANPFVDPLGNAYTDFVVGRVPAVSPATKTSLAELGNLSELDTLVTHPREFGKDRKIRFEGLFLACRHCGRGFKVRQNLEFNVEKSNFLPLTYYISTIKCPLCGQSTPAEFAFLHGL